MNVLVLIDEAVHSESRSVLGNQGETIRLVL